VVRAIAATSARRAGDGSASRRDFASAICFNGNDPAQRHSPGIAKGDGMTHDPACASISVTALHGIPEIAAGQQLAPIIAEAARETGVSLRPGDIVVAAQKIVSKAEGRLVRLDTVTPGEDALRLAAETGKDPRLVELVLRESQSVLRAAPGVLIVRHRLGLVMANAGIDQSNVPGGADHALLLRAGG
jgi:coenzyme F420-0:L-glutamate ligase/coenzyme F420-1:gamma-L-glutamate ligase